MQPSRDISRLIEIMAALRTPVTGCPWDLEQTFATIAPYTIEEAYEVADAIARADLADLKDELGDLLLQVVYHAQLASETGAFAFPDVVQAVTTKMIRRHPHVFGDEVQRTAGAVAGMWERIKAEERAEKAAERARLAALGPTPVDPVAPADPTAADPTSVDATALDATASDPAGPRPKGLLADVPVGLPALTRAIKLQDKAARVGFDWPSLAQVFDKMKEEVAELAEVAIPADPRGGAAPHHAPGVTDEATRRRIFEEMGDVLFVMANVARHLKLDPEAALRAANDKFTRRFAHIEARLAERGRDPSASDLAEMDALWDEARAADKAAVPPLPVLTGRGPG